MRARIAAFVIVVQSILFLAHWFVYWTWVAFRPAPLVRGGWGLELTLVVLSVSFVAASLLVFRYSNFLVRALYRAAGIWLGILNFTFVAACFCWIAYLGAKAVGWPVGRSAIADVMFGMAILVSVYGVINAAWVRVKRIRVRLPNLPHSWRGRVAAMVSDIHLGPVNGYRFMRRIVAKLRRLRPDAVFIAGDLYDGSRVDQDAVAQPWTEISPPFGSYFVTGNHEEFADSTQYLEAVSRSGVRVLNNEKVTVDGLQIVGVHDRDLANPERFQSILKEADLDRSRASILLAHVPHRLAIAEKEGISLQLSGHTHGGQIFPFTWFTRKIFREFTYGLRRFGELLVYTSSGAGTWGPPMRVGTQPEILLIEFE